MVAHCRHDTDAELRCLRVERLLARVAVRRCLERGRYRCVSPEVLKHLSDRSRLEGVRRGGAQKVRIGERVCTGAVRTVRCAVHGHGKVCGETCGASQGLACKLAVVRVEAVLLGECGVGSGM